jgi:carboxyl-terminal processing protease
MQSQRPDLVPFANIRLVIVAVVVFVIGFMVGNNFNTGNANAQGGLNPNASDDPSFQAFWQTYNLIQSDYLDPEGDEVAQNALVDGAIRGMVDALDDPFSGYITPQQFAVLNSQLSGEFVGIGVTLRTRDDDLLEVVNVLPNAPAQKAGIQAGDIFWSVNGEDATRLNQTELGNLVRGEEGTEVIIVMLREDELIEFTMVRARIQIPNITMKVFMPDGTMLAGDEAVNQSTIDINSIAYIQLYEFSENAYLQLVTAMDDLEVNSRKALILDLRGNPGGFLTVAQEIGGLFIEDGTLLIEDFGTREEILTTQNTFYNLQVPLVVLVDGNSASASELVSGAWQDLDVATIVGDVTFGKGTVQTWQALDNGGGVRLTIARWKTPKGRWIHGNGIRPDIIVPWQMTDFETQFAIPGQDAQLDAALAFIETGVIPPQPEATAEATAEATVTP